MSANNHSNTSRWTVLDDAWVNGFTLDSFIATLHESTARKKRTIVLNHNMNSLTLYFNNERFRQLYQKADLCFIDGQPIVYLARIHGNPARSEHRIAVLDWLWPLFGEAADNGWRITHIGSTQDNLRNVADVIRVRQPSLRLTTIPGFFDPQDLAANRKILDQVAHSHPDILLIGMGMPRQELWLLDNLDALPDCPTITIGGALGYLGGDRPTPPRWLGRLGLEWAYRLVTEPRRLWRRYLLEPLPLLPRLARAAFLRIRQHWRLRIQL